MNVETNVTPVSVSEPIVDETVSRLLFGFDSSALTF